MLNCKINGTVHILFLKSHISAPGDQDSPIFSPSWCLPNLFTCHNWFWSHLGPLHGQNLKKKSFLVVHDFGYPQVVGAFVSKWLTCWSVSKKSRSSYMLAIELVSFGSKFWPTPSLPKLKDKIQKNSYLNSRTGHRCWVPALRLVHHCSPVAQRHTKVASSSP